MHVCATNNPRSLMYHDILCIWKLPNCLPMDDIVKTLGAIYDGAKNPKRVSLRVPAKPSRYFREPPAG